MLQSPLFSVLSSINPDDESSWNGRIFLTLDMDWAHDEVLLDSIQLVRDSGVKTTWFVTHKTALLVDFEQDSNIELGIHPNFNPLLNGVSNIDSSKVIADCFSIVPSARSIRSHSLTQSERLVDQFKDAGITHVSNLFLPYESRIQPKPFFLWGRMIVVPHSWQDNVAIKMGLSFPTRTELVSGLHVFNFHPIHIFLNTEDLDRYERTDRKSVV